MRIICILILIFLVYSCQDDKQIVKKPPIAESKEYNFDSVFDKAYDIADLRAFSDTSKFIARIRINEPFHTPSVIELDEVANGINLCVKFPVVMFTPGDTIKGNRSLPFNQDCYWFADEKATEIQAVFYPFNNNKVTTDFGCPNCLDVLKWQVEIYDHGLYSSLEKDYMNKTDSAFINFIRKEISKSDK